MKATQLEQMKEDFFHIKTTKRITEDKVEQNGEVWTIFTDFRVIRFFEEYRFK